MTIRAILLGLLGAALLCGLTFFNDAVMHHSYLVGNNMPISVYGGLILFLLIFNPLLYFIWKRLALSGPELALVVTLVLASACIPGSGLMRTFTTSLVMPYKYEQTTPAWQKPAQPKPWRKDSVLKQVEPYMLVQVDKDNANKVLNGFASGTKVGKKNIDVSQVPWGAWVRPLAFWIPCILLLWIGLLGLSMVVHKQWSEHEQLPYPIATFANSLLPNAKQWASEMVRNRLFWFGMIPVLLIYLNNYTLLYPPYDKLLIPFPSFLDFSTLAPLFPKIQAAGGWLFTQPRIYFTVIAFAYFLAADVSLALGIGPMVWYLVAGTAVGYGVNFNNGQPSVAQFLGFGSYIGILLVLFYTGRRYYTDVFRAALKLPVVANLSAQAIWGARLFMVAILGFVAYLSILGKLDWQISFIFAAITVLIFLVMSRIVAETGVFFVQTAGSFGPAVILVGLLGSSAIGPQTMLIMMFFTTVLLIDPREAFMPFTVNSLKLMEMRGLNIGKVAPVIIVALLIGFAVAIPATLYCQYNFGTNAQDGWASQIVPSMPFEQAIAMETRLEAQDRLAEASTVHGWGHFAKMAPNPSMLIAFAIGLGLFLLFTAGRLRFSKWPIHPVIFLIWNTFPAGWLAGSFLFGWLVKVLVTKFGGSKLFHTLKPLMIGLIAGEMAGGVITIIIGFIIYLYTGEFPKAFRIMPG